MKKARIYQPSKSAMQSGKAKTHRWILEYPAVDLSIDEIVGWTGSTDMYHQEVKLFFATKEEAVSYATKNNVTYELDEKVAPNGSPKLRTYSSNFQ